MMTKKVLVTGVSRGFGKALAETALERGCRVLGMGKRCPASFEDREAFEFIRVDLAALETIGAKLAKALGKKNSPDVVFLNAGVGGPIGSSGGVSVGEIESVLRINTLANKVVLDAVLEKTPQPSQVIGISSGASFNGSGGWLAYSMSKAAFNLLLRVYSHEFPQTHFSAVAPGIIRTAMTESICEQPLDDRFPANARIRKAFDEGRAHPPITAAKRLWELLSAIMAQPSGAYVDVRNLRQEGNG